MRRGVHQSSGELEAAIYRYLDVTNEDPKPFVWTKTADQILANVARFLPTNFEYMAPEVTWLSPVVPTPVMLAASLGWGGRWMA